MVTFCDIYGSTQGGPSIAYTVLLYMALFTTFSTDYRLLACWEDNIGKYLSKILLIENQY